MPHTQTWALTATHDCDGLCLNLASQAGISRQRWRVGTGRSAASTGGTAPLVSPKSTISAPNCAYRGGFGALMRAERGLPLDRFGFGPAQAQKLTSVVSFEQRTHHAHVASFGKPLVYLCISPPPGPGATQVLRAGWSRFGQVRADLNVVRFTVEPGPNLAIPYSAPRRVCVKRP